MSEKRYCDALREALEEEMDRDEDVFLMGEDIAVHGGDFKVTEGLLEKFGEERVLDTPISETGFTGLAFGAATEGLRPVVEIMFSDFVGAAGDQLLNQIPKMTYVSDGKVSVPLVIRTASGVSKNAGPQHSQSLEAIFTHIPGWKVVIPSVPRDAKGLMKASIRDDNPVMFLEQKRLYYEKGEVPDEEYLVKLGEAEVKREGADVTVISTGLMVHRSLSAAEKLEEDGIEAEVVDLRTTSPLDTETIIESVKKTGRGVVVHEAWKKCGVGAEITSIIMEEAFSSLERPVVRLAGLDVPTPFSPAIEEEVFPREGDIIKTVKDLF